MTQQNNNTKYELANAINELFDHNDNLPYKELNACINCPLATWYKTSNNSVNATCSRMNVVVWKSETDAFYVKKENANDKRTKIPGVSVCSGNPTFKPEQ